MVWEPYLRAYIGGGFLYVLDAWGDVDGSGTGFTAQLGVEAELFDFLHVGGGYELYQFTGMKDIATQRQVSDIYHSAFLRVGWNWSYKN